MTLPASDNFNTADQSGLARSGFPWVVVKGTAGAQIIGNAAAGADDNLETGVVWNETFDPNQYAEARIAQRGNLSYSGLLVRGTTNNYYLVYTDDGQRYFGRIVAGSYTSFAIDTPLAVNDVVRIEADGTEISVYINGVLWTSVTDSSHATGQAGVAFYDNITSTRIDDWQGGNLNDPPQVARPTSTITVGAWTDQAGGTTNMHGPLADETDTTYIQSEEDPTSSYVEVALGPLTDPVTSAGHIVRYRYSKYPASANQMDLVVQLRQGSSTVIASATHANIGDSIVNGEFTLSATEANSITDYNDLRLRFIATQV
jgi:hypothetical protein